MKKQTSIMSFILSMGLALLLMAIVVVSSMAYGLAAQKRIQMNFMSRTASCDMVLNDLYAMEEVFLKFRRYWSKEGYETYLKACEKLDEDLDQLGSYCQDAPAALNYIRRIRNFNVYQQIQMEEVLEKKEIRYQVSVYVITGLNMHQHQALQMAMVNLLGAKNEYEVHSQAMSHRMLTVAAAFAFMVIVMGAVLARFSFVSKRGLQDMTANLSRLAARDWDTPDLGISRFREYNLISQTVNRMKQEIRQSINEIEDRARLEKQLDEERLINEKQQAMMIAAQMSALRSQVNPHFLFNCLNLIGVTALIGDSKKVMQMVEATGMILRYSLYHKGLMTSLDQELEIVRHFLFLQKCRFKDTVRAEIHNELEGEDIRIPVMSIQPIVENCFKHGFGCKDSLYIHIAVTWEDGKAAVCVTDDGMGFHADKIQEEGSGIGLDNIRRRMELMYDGQAEMEIKSEPDVYTSITLLIPQKEEQSEGSGC